MLLQYFTVLMQMMVILQNTDQKYDRTAIFVIQFEYDLSQNSQEFYTNQTIKNDLQSRNGQSFIIFWNNHPRLNYEQTK